MVILNYLLAGFFGAVVTHLYYDFRGSVLRFARLHGIEAHSKDEASNSVDLDQIQKRLDDVSQGWLEGWDLKEYHSVVSASQEDVVPLLEEVRRLRDE